MCFVYNSHLLITFWLLLHTKKQHIHPLGNLAHIIMQIVSSLLSLCMAKWLSKWWRGWLYVRSNNKNTKSLITMFSTGVITQPGSWSLVQFLHEIIQATCTNVWWFYVINDVCLCCASHLLVGWTMASGLLLPPVGSAEVMWKCPILG